MADLKLVKDFQNYQFVYYWTNQNDIPVSEHLPTLHHAQDWIIAFYHDNYTGVERRKRRNDRRLMLGKKRLSGQDVFFCKRTKKSEGRRITDKPIKVDLDLSGEKLSSLNVLNESISGTCG